MKLIVKRKRIEENVKKFNEKYANKEVLLAGGFKGTLIGWCSTNSIGDVSSAKVKIKDKEYEVWAKDIVAIELKKR